MTGALDNPAGYAGSGLQCADTRGRRVACGAKGAAQTGQVLYRPRLPDGSRPRVYLDAPVDVHADLVAARVRAGGRKAVARKVDEALSRAVATSRTVSDRLGGYAGAEAPLLVATAEGCPARQVARYRLVEADALIPSHDPVSFAQRPDYPTGVQERQYHRDRSEQLKVIQQAQCFRPDLLANTNPDAINGPPVVTPDGIVLGGNSRTMTIQRVYAEEPEAAAAYRRALVARARDFGFATSAVGRLTAPVLVRVIVPEDPSPAGLRALVRRYNEAFTQQLDPTAEQVASSGRIDSGVLNALAATMVPGETLSEYLGDNRSRPFLDALQRAGVIDRRNWSALMDPDTGRPNEDGKTFIGRALVGKVVPDPALLDALGVAVRNNLAAAVPAILQAAAVGPKWDVTLELRDAAGLLQRMRAARVDRVRDFLAQTSIVGGVEVPARTRLVLTALSERGGPRQLPAGFRKLAEVAAMYPEEQAGLVPPPTFEEAFTAAFGLEGT